MLTNKLYLFLASGYYYILALLNYDQFLLISWIYEIYLFKISTFWRIASLVFSFILLICHLLIVWVCLIKLKENVQTKQSKLFKGIKQQRKHRLYPSTLLVRRTIFVSFLIWLVIVQSRVLIAILSLIQLILPRLHFIFKTICWNKRQYYWDNEWSLFLPTFVLADIL